MTTKFVLKLKELRSTLWNLQDQLTGGRDDWQGEAHLLCIISTLSAPGGSSRNKVILQDAAGAPVGILQIPDKAQDVPLSTQVSTGALRGVKSHHM